ncbi:MAG: hypothetical protein RIC14_06565 [Filomicrobium sp.]
MTRLGRADHTWLGHGFILEEVPLVGPNDKLHGWQLHAFPNDSYIAFRLALLDQPNFTKDGLRLSHDSRGPFAQAIWLSKDEKAPPEARREIDEAYETPRQKVRAFIKSSRLEILLKLALRVMFAIVTTVTFAWLAPEAPPAAIFTVAVLTLWLFGLAQELDFYLHQRMGGLQRASQWHRRLISDYMSNYASRSPLGRFFARLKIFFQTSTDEGRGRVLGAAFGWPFHVIADVMIWNGVCRALTERPLFEFVRPQTMGHAMHRAKQHQLVSEGMWPVPLNVLLIGLLLWSLLDIAPELHSVFTAIIAVGSVFLVLACVPLLTAGNPAVPFFTSSTHVRSDVLVFSLSVAGYLVLFRLMILGITPGNVSADAVLNGVIDVVTASDSGCLLSMSCGGWRSYTYHVVHFAIAATVAKAAFQLVRIIVRGVPVSHNDVMQIAHAHFFRGHYQSAHDTLNHKVGVSSPLSRNYGVTYAVAAGAFDEATELAGEQLSKHSELPLVADAGVVANRLIWATISPIPLDRLQRYRLYKYLAEQQVNPIRLLNGLEIAEYRHPEGYDAQSLNALSWVLPSPTSEILREASRILGAKCDRLAPNDQAALSPFLVDLLRFREVVLSGRLVLTEKRSGVTQEIDGHPIDVALVPQDGAAMIDCMETLQRIREAWSYLENPIEQAIYLRFLENTLSLIDNPRMVDTRHVIELMLGPLRSAMGEFISQNELGPYIALVDKQDFSDEPLSSKVVLVE